MPGRCHNCGWQRPPACRHDHHRHDRSRSGMKDSTLAFAGMLQAGELVRQTATSGHCSSTAAAVSVGSVFKRSPQSTADVYGGAAGVRVGLQVLTELFSARQKHESMPALNYALGLTKDRKSTRLKYSHVAS